MRGSLSPTKAWSGATAVRALLEADHFAIRKESKLSFDDPDKIYLTSLLMHFLNGCRRGPKIVQSHEIVATFLQLVLLEEQ
jgi:hypothetical protein